MYFNQFFNKIYCINLEKRKDRWDSFNNEIKKYKINDVIKFNAIDGILLNNDTSLLPGELGVLMTHYNIIQECKKNNYETVLIMEDDVKFNDNIRYLSDYMSQIPKDWDMIYFGGNHIYGKTPKKISDNILKLNFTVALHCVAIKNTMFDIILETIIKKEKQVDSYYASLHEKYNVYGINPNLATQITSYSDIQNKFVNYDDFFNKIF